jgi:hypothetical protein
VSIVPALSRIGNFTETSKHSFLLALVGRTDSLMPTMRSLD